METTMKKKTSPIVREYKIGDITYIVKAVVKDGAKEDAVTTVSYTHLTLPTILLV